MNKIKFLVLSVLLVFGFAAKAQSMSLGFKSEDEKLIVDILNDICGDTWCEGPVEIDFQSVNYDRINGSYVIRIATVKDSSNELAQSEISFECAMTDNSAIETLISAKDLYDEQSSKARTKLMQQIDLCIDQKLMPQLKNMI